MNRSAILFFAEDPGAVNFVGPVAAQLGPAGASVLSAGSATALLRNYGVESNAVEGTRHALALWQEANASCLVVGTSENPDSAAFALVQAARAHGCHTVGLVDFAANSAHRFRGRTTDPLAYAPDWLLVPDDWTAQEYRALGFPQERLRVVGHPQYDAALRAKAELDRTGKALLKQRLLPAAGERPVVVFVSEVSTGLDPAQYRRSAEYTLVGRGDADERTEVVLQEVLDAFAALELPTSGRPYLVLRRHPKEDDTHLQQYLPRFDLVSCGGSPLEVVYVADLVIGMSSLLLMEACLLGVPVLSVLPRPGERDWLPVTRSGVIPCVTDRAALCAELDALMARLQREPVVPEVPSQASDAVSHIVSFLRNELAIS
jgi:hypothetical protein